MNYTKAFSYVFEDQDWIKKILVAGLISLIPVVGWIYLLGWSVEIVRRTKAHRTDILPATHFAYFLTLGLKMTVVMLIYTLPVNILSAITKGFSQVIMSDESSIGIQIFFTSASCLSSFLGLLLSIAVSLLTGYGMIRMAETDQIRPCLDIRNAYDSIKNNFKSYILVFLMHFIIGLVEVSGLIVCGIGLLFTLPYGFAVSGHLYGQLWDNLNVPEKKDKVYDATGFGTYNDTVEDAPAKKACETHRETQTDDPIEEAAAAPAAWYEDRQEEPDSPEANEKAEESSFEETLFGSDSDAADKATFFPQEDSCPEAPEEAAPEGTAEDNTAEDNQSNGLPDFD